MTIYKSIAALVSYGVSTGLIQSEDVPFTLNRIFEYLNIEGQAVEICAEMQAVSTKTHKNQLLKQLESILEEMIDWAVETGRLESKSADFADIFDSGLMSCLMGRPSEVIRTFEHLKKHHPVNATDYLYEMGIFSNYIRMSRIEKNKVWKSTTLYGDMDITINLSKPEKDPKAIAAALKHKPIVSNSYPKCLLCVENEGYKGRLDHPARQNLRLIPLELNHEKWLLQYSPYSYYPEHCIVLNAAHVPMKLTEATLNRLVDFVDELPHYFVGSNADLPIVGGSILTHDHFQGGQYEFAMTQAESEKIIDIKGFEDLCITRVKWPMSVIRIKGADKTRVVAAGSHIFKTWQHYSDASVEILSHSGDVPHNTVTPIARRRGEDFELDIVLRNNRTNSEHPDGIFHPHSEIQHIKRENIGLIEVMGLAVLPGRLATELDELADVLSGQKLWGETSPALICHHAWYMDLCEAHGTGMSKAEAWEIIKTETGIKFMHALDHAGVFKRTAEGLEAFDRFVETMR